MKDLALLLIRVVSGGTLAAHGYTKLFGGEGRKPPQFMTRLYGPNFEQAHNAGGPGNFAQALEKMQVPYPSVAAYAAGLAEFGGGLALLAGVKTRLAALAVMFNMGIAIQRAHWKTGFYGQGGYEFPLQLMAAAAALFIAGPGAFSVDGMVGGTRRAAEAVGSAADAVGSGARGAVETAGSGARSVAEAVGSGARQAGGLVGAVPVPLRR